jgi:CTP synthase
MARWAELVRKLRSPGPAVKVALVGKYVQLNDAYLSVVEALRHACLDRDASLDLHWICAEQIEEQGADSLRRGMDAVVVPGGFGNRGVDGKVAAIRWAREQRVPFLGLCLGMQCAVIEWARNQAGLVGATSAELDADTPHPVIHLLPEQQDVVDLGGTMRLGVYPCRLAPGTLGQRLYGDEVVYERHRHRYEFNNAYRNLFLESGYEISGTSPDGRLVELIELKDHPFFTACQYHPEFLSRPGRPHPLFRGLIEAAQRRLPASPSEAINSQRSGLGDSSRTIASPSA